MVPAAGQFLKGERFTLSVDSHVVGLFAMVELQSVDSCSNLPEPQVNVVPFTSGGWPLTAS